MTKQCSSGVSPESHNRSRAPAVALSSYGGHSGYATVTTFVPFDLRNPLDVAKRNLPHWAQPGTTYFITFRLADAIPQEKLNRWRNERENWLKNHQTPLSDDEWAEYNKRFPILLNKWLDNGSGSCILKDDKVSEIVVNAIEHFDGQRYVLGAWIVMPNHVHMLIAPINDYKLEGIMHSLKSYTAHKINKYLSRSGKVWQSESYDHIVRTEKQKNILEEYILNNPSVAKLKSSFKCSKPK